MSSKLPTIPESKMRTYMRMESEHSANPNVQRRIVNQHIKEHGPRYYPELQKMERRLKR